VDRIPGRLGFDSRYRFFILDLNLMQILNEVGSF